MNKVWIGVGIAAAFILSQSKKKPAIVIRNIVDSLPKSSTQTYSTRSLSQINKIVVHHSATTSGTAESYARYHIDNRGWPGIGYHFVIDQNGTINKTNWLETVSYHTGGENTSSVGICLTGNFDIQQSFPAQMAALNALIQHLKSQLGQNLQVYGHRDYSTKSCPGDNIALSSYNADIAGIVKSGKGLIICNDNKKTTAFGPGACSWHRGIKSRPKSNFKVSDSDIETLFFKDYYIAEFLKSHKVSTQSFRRYADVNLMREKLNWISNKGANIDDIAQQLTFKLGVEIVPEDIAQVILDFKSPSDYYQYLKNETSVIMKGQHGIHAIYLLDKCPDFYPCADGTFTTGMGRGVCSKHGGLLSNNSIVPKKVRVKKIAPAQEAEQEELYFEETYPEEVEILENEHYIISNFTNTKTGENLKLVSLKHRVSESVFSELKKQAKANNGYWSSFAKGFLFTNLNDAQNFINSDFDTTTSIPSTSTSKIKVKAETPKIKKLGKISFEMPTGEALKEALNDGKNALDVIKSVDYKDQAVFYKNPSFLNPILVYLEHNAKDKKDKYSRYYGNFAALDYAGIKIIAPKWFKELYPDAQNVRISSRDYSTLDLSATFPSIYKEKEKEIEEQGKYLLKWFSYDDSDSQIDYFNVRYYVHVNLKFEDKEVKEVRKSAPKYFWSYSKRNKKWILSEFYFGNENKPSFASNIGLKRKRTESYSDVFDRAKDKYSAFGINFDGAELGDGYGNHIIYKEQLLNGDITEEEALKFYDNINGIESSRSSTAGNLIGAAILAYIGYKALSK